jgi:sugar lactone lactonase YvrE
VQSVQRGPVSLSMSGDPEGLWWDEASSTLYIADQENNQILTWTDAGGFKTWSTLPGGAQAGQDLGQIVLTPAGNLVVIVFGFGTNGAIDIVAPDGTASVISGLDVTFRRLGLTQASDGTFYESYFAKASEASEPAGYVAKLTLTSTGSGWSGTETPVVTGLGKPVGVVGSGSTLYITDQATNDFYGVPIASLPTSTAAVLGSNLALDLISVGPSGTFFTGSSTGNLERLTATGMESVFVSGYANPRGSAYDAVHDRVFFGNHVTSSGANQLVIVPGP